MKIYDESLYCQECNCEISVAQSKFCCNYCDNCFEQKDNVKDKYINQPMKELCAELEEVQAWEDEHFMDELDQALGFNSAKQETFLCCGCPGGWCEGCVPDETLLDECGWEG